MALKLILYLACLVCIGISSAGNDSKSAAQNVSHTLIIYDKEEEKVVLINQGSDAGGGATREDFGEKLDKEGRVKDRNEYNVSTCTLHAMNLCLASPTELTMGSGGLKKGLLYNYFTQPTTLLSVSTIRNGNPYRIW